MLIIFTDYPLFPWQRLVEMILDIIVVFVTRAKFKALTCDDATCVIINMFKTQFYILNVFALNNGFSF